MKLRYLASTCLILLAVGVALASPAVTLPELETLYPAYVNHAEMTGFENPCVDVDGTMTIENTGWPEGCIDLLDFAAWDLLSVPAPDQGFGPLKATFGSR